MIMALEILLAAAAFVVSDSNEAFLAENSLEKLSLNLDASQVDVAQLQV